MHKLGNTLTSNDQKEEIRRILAARRKLYNAGVALLECDRVYAENIKRELEGYTLAGYIVSSAEEAKKPIDETDIRLYLETFLRIYVKEENITIDTKNGLCKIQLQDKLAANIPIVSEAAGEDVLWD